MSNQRAITNPADFTALTEPILILSQSILVYNLVEYGMFHLYSLSGVHRAAIPVNVFYFHLVTQAPTCLV